MLWSLFSKWAQSVFKVIEAILSVLVILFTRYFYQFISLIGYLKKLNNYLIIYFSVCVLKRAAGSGSLLTR